MGGSSKADPNNPPLNAKSKEEESFIKYVGLAAGFDQRGWKVLKS